jgi:hypothetical protein
MKGKKPKKKMKHAPTESEFSIGHSKFHTDINEATNRANAVKRELFEKGPNFDFLEWK